FVGNLADRFGTARTVAGGGMLYVAGMLMIALASEGVMLTVGNVLSGVGLAAAGFGPILGAIARQTPPAQRSVALGVATARRARGVGGAGGGGAFGQFAIVPIASIRQNRFGNRHTTVFVVTGASAVMGRLGVGLREGPSGGSVPFGAAGTQSAKNALEKAFGMQGFWLLTIGFFVCGFHVSFIGLHLPAYISDKAIGMSVFGRPISALELRGWAIGLLGLLT